MKYWRRKLLKKSPAFHSFSRYWGISENSVEKKSPANGEKGFAEGICAKSAVRQTAGAEQRMMVVQCRRAGGERGAGGRQCRAEKYEKRKGEEKCQKREKQVC